MPRAWSLLDYVLVCSNQFRVLIGSSPPFMGRPTFPFIGQGKARVTVKEKEEDEKEKKSSRIDGSFFSFRWVPLTM